MVGLVVEVAIAEVFGTRDNGNCIRYFVGLVFEPAMNALRVMTFLEIQMTQQLKLRD